MKRYLKEAIILVFVGIPFIYLTAIWSSFPERVPIHFRDSSADGWSSKMGLLYLTISVVIGFYLLVIIPATFTLKERLVTMGYTPSDIRLVLAIFIAVLMIFSNTSFL